MTATPLVKIPPTLAAITDYEPVAREHLDDNAWAYVSGGAADEITLRENITAYDRIKLVNRVLARLDGAHTRVTLFDQEHDAPILLAPVAHQKLFHQHGESAAALGASAMRTGLVLSTLSNVSLEEVARVATAPLWFQLYFQPRRESTATLVERAEIAGYKALVVTVDSPVNGMRNREQRVQFQLPFDITPANLRDLPDKFAEKIPDTAARPGSILFGPVLDRALSWDDIAWLRSKTTLPILLKGILNPADVEPAIQHGASGVIVSNHGGRNLDTFPATIEALPGVVAAAQGRIPVLVDGGIRRGTDVLKALALGASAVLVGRPAMHALAVAGAVGVAHIIKVLRAELEVAMAMTGCRTVADITPAVLWKR